MVGAPAPISYVLPFPPLFPSFCPAPPPHLLQVLRLTEHPQAGAELGLDPTSSASRV